MHNLTHTVDNNWLEEMVDGRKGIFPKNYIKVCVCVCVTPPLLSTDIDS